jgi:hypothetical protein
MKKSTDKQKGNTANRKPWKKGQSGNPAGRPSKAETLTSLLKAEMERSDSANPNDKRTWNDRIVLATLRLAEQGLPAALKEVWERCDGRVRQDIGVEMNLHAQIVANLQGAQKREAALPEWSAQRNRVIDADGSK